MLSMVNVINTNSGFPFDRHANFILFLPEKIHCIGLFFVWYALLCVVSSL